MFMSCESRPEGIQRSAPDSRRDLHGKVVLVVEDEFMIAIDYAMHLEALGATVLGPVASVSGALDVLQKNRVDAAVLDIDLQGTKAFTVADALIDRRIGFVFASGYDDVVIPDRFAGVIRCAKPADAAEIADCVLRVLAG